MRVTRPFLAASRRAATLRSLTALPAPIASPFGSSRSLASAATAEPVSLSGNATRRRGGAPAPLASPREGRRQLRVLAMYESGPIKIAQLERRVTSERWEASLDRDWIVFTSKVADGELPGFVCVSRRGATILANCDLAKAKEDILDLIQHPSVAQPMPLGARRLTDYMTLEVDPSLPAWFEVEPGGGEVRMRELSRDGVRTIASVMGESVMLQYYEQGLDRLYDSVESLNRKLQDKTLDSVPRKELYRLLNKNHLIHDLVLLTGLRDTMRPGSPAWRDVKFADLHDRLMDDYELGDRYEELEHKLDFVSNIVKFCIDQQEDGALHRLEWLIVAILAFELLLSLEEFAEKMKEDRERETAAAATALLAIATSNPEGGGGGGGGGVNERGSQER